ncbi:MAG: hypothetical protein H0X13_01725 [Ramlibacter sp.]|nr:hypothetical protein [Ramlibacter sp.]
MNQRLRVAVLGRTEMLLEGARLIASAGHEVPLVGTCKASDTSQVTEHHYEAFARPLGADFFCTAAINAPAQLQLLRLARCDLAISMNWISLIEPETRASFRLGVFNAHPGDLPRYRGNACPNWAILAGEPHVGLCIHQMVDALDAGPVALRDHFPLGESTDVEDVYRWMRSRVPELFLELVERAARGELELRPQPEDPALALRCYPRRPEDSRIDWSRSGQDVYRLVRASTRPTQGAYTLLEGERRVVVWRAQPFDSLQPFLARPGQVCMVVDGDPVIACGQGMLRLTDIAIDGCAGAADAKRQVASSLRNRLV